MKDNGGTGDRVAPAWVVGAAFLLGLAWYGFTQLTGADASSAAVLSSFAGVNPFPPLDHPLWKGFLQVVSAFPAGSLTFRLNAFSVVCAAGLLAMLAVLAWALPHDRSAEEREVRHHPSGVRAVTAGVTVLFAAACHPLWMLGTRAAPLSFDLLLLALAVLPLIRFAAGGSWRWIPLSSFLFGMGFTESILFFYATPFAIVLTLWVCLIRLASESRDLAHHPGLMFKALLPTAGWSAGATVLGTWPMFAYALWYRGQPAFEWREQSSTWQVIRQMMVEQYHALGEGLPQVGWLLVLLLMVLPFLLVVVLRMPADRRENQVNSTLLHILLGGIGLVVLLAPAMRPVEMTALGPQLALPTLLTAIWFGYLAGYARVLLGHPAGSRSLAGPVRRLMGFLAPAAIGGGLLAATYLNGRLVLENNRQATWPLAQEIVRAAGDRPWLLGNGFIDDLVMLAAREAGSPLTVLNPRQGSLTGYRNLLASRFDDPLLKGRARLGLGPLITEWIARDTNVTEKLAVIGSPDLWLANGRKPLVDGPLYLGLPAGAPLPGGDWMKAQGAFWERAANWPGREPSMEKAPYGQVNDWAFTYVSKTANDTGFLLEEAERPAEAREAYEAARRLQPGNISALLNLCALSEREKNPDAAALKKLVEAVDERQRTGWNLWTLSYRYGYVRQADWFANRGLAWAVSGRPNLAQHDLQQAMKMGLDPQSVQMAVARLYLAQDRTDEGEKALLDMLEKDPENRQAVWGLFSLALGRGDFDRASGYLARLRELKADERLVRRQQVLLDWMAGRRDAAREELKRLVHDDPEDVETLVMRAFITAEDREPAAFKETIEQLQRRLQKLSARHALALARLLLEKGETAGARPILDRVLQEKPGDVPALELLLQACAYEAKSEEARAVAGRLLTVDPDNALGNLINGSLLFKDKLYSLAEAAFRRSAEVRPGPLVLNELAYTLYVQDRFDEAMKTARKSLDLDERSGPAWDTYGAAALRLGKLDEAGEALRKAVSLAPDNPDILFHMAEWHEARGQLPAAIDILNKLVDRAGDMEIAQYEKVRQKLSALRAAAPKT